MAQNKHKPKAKKKPKKNVKKISAMSNYFKKWDPQQALRGKDAQRELYAATRMEFDPQKRELNRAMAGSDARQAQIDKWYNEYQGHLQQLSGQTAAAYGQANQQLGQFSQQTGALDATNRQGIEDSARADAQLRGVDYNPSGGETAANAANARQQLLQAQQARVGGQGANQAAFGANLQASAGKEGIESHTAEASRRQMLESDARELAAKEGDFRTDFLRQLREDERKYGIEKAAAKVDKFEARTKRKSAKETGRHNRQSEAETARGHTLTRKSSKEGHDVTTAGQRAQNIRDRKNRRQGGRSDAERARHNRAMERNAAKGGKSKKKKPKVG